MSNQDENKNSVNPQSYGRPQQPYAQQPYAPRQPYAQPSNGQMQQPYAQQLNGQAQQPYAQQPNVQPQQPYAPQQPYVQQPYVPQQPYVQQPYAPPQQVVYVAPTVQAGPPKATEEEKGASFSAAGSVFMLILCIVGTVNLITGLISDILSLNIGGLLLFVLDILIVIGMWITFANAKKKKLSPKGISLIRVPYTIQFVFSVFSFIGNLVVWFFTLNVINLLVGIVSFIMSCVCFASVKNMLVLAESINKDVSVKGKKAGIAAAVIMIISATITFLQSVIGYVTLAALTKLLEDKGAPKFLVSLLGGGGVMVLVVAAITFLVGICGAIVMIKLSKNLKKAHGEV